MLNFKICNNTKSRFPNYFQDAFRCLTHSLLAHCALVGVPWRLVMMRIGYQTSTHSQNREWFNLKVSCVPWRIYTNRRFSSNYHQFFSALQIFALKVRKAWFCQTPFLISGFCLLCVWWTEGRQTGKKTSRHKQRIAAFKKETGEFGDKIGIIATLSA